MAKMHLMGAALVAATVVASGCNKGNGETSKPVDDAAAETCCQNGACTAAKDPNEVVLTVCGKELKRGELDADVAKIVAAQGDRIPAEQLEIAKIQFANQLAQQFVIETALLDKAVKSGYTASDEDLKAREAEFLKAVAGRPDSPKTLEEALAKHPLGIERARAEMKSGVIIDKMLKAEVSAKDTTDYSDKAKEIVDRIVAENAKCLDDDAALAKINGIKATLDATPAAELSAKFAELAESESACPSGKKGGDLGEFTHGQMVKEFDEAAFASEIGKVVGPVKTQFGYHLIMTTKKLPAVEAKDGQPAVPEKVQASHILIKTGEKQEVPELAEVIEYLKSNASRPLVSKFIMECVQNSAITAIDEFKQFIPPAPKAEEIKEAVKEAAEAVKEEAKEAVEEIAEKAVETPAEK